MPLELQSANVPSIEKDTTREEPALILQQVMELKRNQEEYERNLQELTERHQSMEVSHFCIIYKIRLAN